MKVEMAAAIGVLVGGSGKAGEESGGEDLHFDFVIEDCTVSYRSFGSGDS